MADYTFNVINFNELLNCLKDYSSSMDDLLNQIAIKSSNIGNICRSEDSSIGLSYENICKTLDSIIKKNSEISGELFNKLALYQEFTMLHEKGASHNLDVSNENLINAKNSIDSIKL